MILSWGDVYYAALGNAGKLRRIALPRILMIVSTSEEKNVDGAYERDLEAV